MRYDEDGFANHPFWSRNSAFVNALSSHQLAHYGPEPQLEILQRACNDQFVYSLDECAQAHPLDLRPIVEMGHA